MTITTPLPRRTLAEQMADGLTEAILAGQWPAGAALPTEPELAAQFGVSRAVVRDATRMLAARGLVDAQHGRGVFVTASGVAAFGDALLLALRRAGATVWDVERFEQMVLPAVAAEAARHVSDVELDELRRLAAERDRVYADMERRYWAAGTLPESELETFMAPYRAFFAALFAATHNAVWRLLAEPLLRLRSPRQWLSGDMTEEAFIAHEAEWFAALLAAVASRDPEHAYAVVAALGALPPAAEAAMRATPVGHSPQIPLSLAELSRSRAAGETAA